MSTKFSPNATPEPTVSAATLFVNRCGVTSSSVACRLTSTTATIASATPATATTPGRSPRATPTPTGTAAVSTAVSGETTEIGPAPSAAYSHHTPHAWPMPPSEPHITAPAEIGPPTTAASTPSNTTTIG